MNRKKIENWIYYNKWWVLICAFFALAAVDMLWQAVKQVKPDYQIACVTESALPEDTVNALQSALAELGQDLNGDGKVVVSIRTYPVLSQSTDPEAARIRAGNETKLVGDILQSASCFFLLDDPDNFQLRYHTLAMPDGSAPAEEDTEGLSKTVLWADCPVLSGLELGNYKESVMGIDFEESNQSVLAGLYLGRRYYPNPDSVKNREAYDALWNTITRR